MTGKRLTIFSRNLMTFIILILILVPISRTLTVYRANGGGEFYQSAIFKKAERSVHHEGARGKQEGENLHHAFASEYIYGDISRRNFTKRKQDRIYPGQIEI